MKKILKLLTNKILITAFFLLLQMAILVLLIVFLSALSMWVYMFFGMLSVVVCFFILARDANPAYKLAWVVPILILPIFGGMMFLTIGRQSRMGRKLRTKLEFVTNYTQELLDRTNDANGDLEDTLEPKAYKIYNFIANTTKYPVYDNTQTTYYSCGEKFYIGLLEALKTAKKFIFLEYFIIEDGVFWQAILDVLQQKVSEGVDVRVIYDDVGCLFTLPASYYKKLNQMGIKTHIFNKVKLTFDIRLNNRTHRKIAVIDSKIAFTGGINIADEYINKKVKYGYWKDSGMKFDGYAAWSFTIMFLRFWLLLDSSETDNIVNLLPEPQGANASGFVQPLGAGPGLTQQVIENAFLQIIGNANKYVYINTPYLILDNEFVTALCLAAKSGVDVRITMPHIPDKKTVFIVSRSFYPILLKAGVKIYEFLPGFVHAKSFVSDDDIGYIGTCNLDYRSFYLHYECGALLYNTESLADIKQDYLKTLEDCKQITLEEANNVTIFTKIARSFLRLFAPLL